MEHVINEIERKAGHHFDPAVVAALIDSKCYRHVTLSPMHPSPAIEVALSESWHSAA